MAKLTLSADPKTIRQAKKLAKQNNTSVSAMFARIIRSMSTPPKEEELGPITRSSLGLVRWPKGKTYREVLEDALMEKYGLEP